MGVFSKLVVGAVMAMGACLAYADLIKVTATGVILDSEDRDGTVFGHGAGSGQLVGKSVVQHFFYDSSAAAAVVVDEYGYVIYGANRGKSSWIQASTMIDGQWLALPTESAGAFAGDLVTIGANAPGTYLRPRDSIQIEAYSAEVHTTDAGDVTWGAFAFLSLVDEPGFLKDAGLNQAFALYDLPADKTGGFLSISRALVRPSGTQFLATGSIGFRFDSVVFERVSEVPEPSSLLFIAMGLGFMGAHRRWVQTKR